MQQYTLGEHTISEAQLIKQAEDWGVSLKELIEANKDLKVKPFSREELSNTTFQVGGTEFSFDQLSKQAEEWDVSVEELIAANPEMTTTSRVGDVLGMGKYQHASDQAFIDGTKSFMGTFQEKSTVKFLKDHYEGTGIKFEEWEKGKDSVKITLPNSDVSRVFNLAFGEADLTDIYSDMKNFMESKDVYEIPKNVENEITNVIPTQNPAWFLPGEKGKGWVGYEDRIVKDLTTILEREMPGKYEIEKAGFLKNQVTITNEWDSKRTFDLSKVETVAGDIIQFLKSNPKNRKNSQVYNDQGNNFKEWTRENVYEKVDENEFLEDGKTPNPWYGKSLIEKITDYTYLQNVELSGDVDEIRNYVKDLIGYHDLFTADEPNKRTEWKDLTTNDYNNLLDELFYEELGKEKKNNFMKNVAGQTKRLIDSGDTVEDYMERYINADIDTYVPGTTKYKLAKEIQKLYTTELSETEKASTINSIKGYQLDLKNSDDPHNNFLDLATGERSSTEGKGWYNLSPQISMYQKDYEEKVKINGRDALGIMYQNNALALANHNANMDEEVYMQIPVDLIDEMVIRGVISKPSKGVIPDAKTFYGKEKGLAPLEEIDNYRIFKLRRGDVAKFHGISGILGGGKITQVNEDGSFLRGEKELSAESEIFLNDSVELNSKAEALRNLYLLNESIGSWEKWKPGETRLHSALGSIIDPVVGDERYRYLAGDTRRQQLDTGKEIYNDLGYKLTAEEKNNIYYSLGEEATETTFGMAGILLGFAALAPIEAGVFAATGIDAFIAGSRAKRYWSTAKGHKSMTSRELITAAQAEKISWRSYAAKYGYDDALKGVGRVSRARQGAAIAIKSLSEGAKFELLMPGGFETGVGFALAGQLIPWKIFKQNPRLEAFNKYMIKGPTNFAVGSEAGELMSGLVDDLLGNKEFSDFMSEHYHDYSQIERRTIVNLITGATLGLNHFNRHDFKSKAQLRLLRMTANKGMRAAEKEGEKKAGVGVDRYWDPKRRAWVDKKTGKKYIRENDPEYMRHYETWQMAQGRINSIDGMEAWNDPIQSVYLTKNQFKKQIEKMKAAGYEVEIKIVHRRSGKDVQDEYMIGPDGKEYKTGRKEGKPSAELQEMINKKRNATWEVDPLNKKKMILKINAEYVKPGIAPHEIGHMGFYAVFGESVRFKGEFISVLEKMAKEIDLHAALPGVKKLTLFDAINERYGKKEWEMLREWELFSHLAEELSLESNRDALRKSGVFDKLKNILKEAHNEKLGIEPDLRTEWDVVKWFSEYVNTVEKGYSALEKIKQLETFILPETARKAREKKGAGSHEPLSSENLRKSNVELFSKYWDPKAHAWTDEEAKKQFNENVKEIDKLKKQGEIKSGKFIKKGTTEESDANRKVRVNTIYENYKELIHTKTEKDTWADKIKGEAKEAILESYKGKVISIGNKVTKSGKTIFETPTFEKMSKKEKGDFAWDITKEELIKHLDRFNLEFRETGKGIENTDLDAYINTYLPEKFGTALKKPGIYKKFFTGEMPERGEPGYKEPSYDPADIIPEKADLRQTIDLNKAWKVPKKAEKLVDELVAKLSPEQINAIMGYAGLKDFVTLTGGRIATGSPFTSIPKKVADLIFGNTTKKRINFIGEHVSVSKKAGLPDGGMTRTGEKLSKDLEGVSTRVSKSLMTIDIGKGKKKILKDVLYETGKTEFISKDTGRLTIEADPKASGLKMQSKIDLSDTEHLKRLGIKSAKVAKEVVVDGKGKKKTEYETEFVLDRTLAEEYAKEEGAKSADAIMRNLQETTQPNYLNELGRAYIYQRLMKRIKDPNLKKLGVFTEIIGNQISAGKPKLASERLGKQRFDDQLKIYVDIQTSLFKKIYLENVTDPTHKNPVGIALKTYYTDPKNRGKYFDVTNSDLMMIGEQIGKKLKIEGMDIKALQVNIGKSILFRNDHAAIENYHGVPVLHGPNFRDQDFIEKGREVEFMLAEHLEGKYGEGTYERFLQDGSTGPGGIGGYKNAKIKGLLDIVLGEKGDIRQSVFRNVEDVKKWVVSKVKSTKQFDGGKKNSWITDKNLLMKEVEFTKNSNKWNEAKRKKAYETAEENKKILKDVVEKLNEWYMPKTKENPNGGTITYKHVRAFVDIHSGSMKGLIKSSASLAVMPIGSPKDIFKIFPEKIKKLDKHGKVVKKDGKIVWESGWVLEHTTPAKEISTFIYDYILEKDPKSKKIKKKWLDDTLDNYHTTLLPKSLDVMVNKIYQMDLPALHTPGMDPIEARYQFFGSDFNIKLARFDNKGNIIKTYGPTGLTIKQTQQYNKRMKEFNSVLIPKSLNKYKSLGVEPLNSEILRDLKSIDAALALGRKGKKEKRGMSAWDLDDTLIRSKSGVRYTLPNPSGKPAPGRKVIFMAGGPGSGKSTVIKGLNLKKQGFKIVNQDISLEWLMKNHGLPKDMKDFTPEQASKFGSLGWDARMIAKRKQTKFQGKGDGIIVDGTGNSLKTMENQVQEFKNKGYDVQMVFVETSLETALQRNRARKERSLRDGIVIKTHESVQNNKEAFRELFGDNFAEVKTDNLKIGDPMPIDVIGKMDAFTKGYVKDRLDPGEYADKGEMLKEQGAEFDFTEFDYVKEGEKGPLFGKAMGRAKKFGTKDQFILTARPHAAKESIHEFLKAQGLNIPLKNIITLENSAAEAKVMWMMEKFSEGYNDMYFADDALANVKAVKNVLDQLDIKSKVQQAKKLASEKLSVDFNKIIEETTGFKAGYEVGAPKARILGKDKRSQSIILPGAQDFMGLMYNFMGKGKEGEAHKKFFVDNLQKPFARGWNDMLTHRQGILDDFKRLKKITPEINGNLAKTGNKYRHGFSDIAGLKTPSTWKTAPGSKYSYEQAVRVYLWNKGGFEAPGLSKRDAKLLNEIVMNDPILKNYADQLGALTKENKGYIEPGDYWVNETIMSDVYKLTQERGMKKYLAEFIENKNIIFSEANMQKIEATQGKPFREALEDVLWRMEKGTNRPTGNSRETSMFMNWVNGSVGATMNWNMRSAIIQQLSTINFLNWKDNNPLMAAKAFANQPQFWKDYSTIWNSSVMRQRRKGLKINVHESEIADAVSAGGIRGAFNYFLKLGFTPTILADSHAISFGGATFYRNRINSYLREGFSKTEAETQAFKDFQARSEPTQQSSRPDLVSKWQADPILGRLIFPFSNVNTQNARRADKGARDAKNNRGNQKENLSRVGNYGLLQPLLYGGLSAGLIALYLDEDEDFTEKEKQDKVWRTANTMLDSQLRGLGYPGAVISAGKNTMLEYHKQSQKPNPDHTYTMLQMTSVSPVVNIKLRNIYSGLQTTKYNKKVIEAMPYWDLDNPHWFAKAQIIQGTTNIPTGRFMYKRMNMKEAMDADNQWWQRAHHVGGWAPWDLGTEIEEIEEFKESVKGKETRGRGRSRTRTRTRTR